MFVKTQIEITFEGKIELSILKRACRVSEKAYRDEGRIADADWLGMVVHVLDEKMKSGFECQHKFIFTNVKSLERLFEVLTLGLDVDSGSFIRKARKELYRHIQAFKSSQIEEKV